VGDLRAAGPGDWLGDESSAASSWGFSCRHRPHKATLISAFMTEHDCRPELGALPLASTFRYQGIVERAVQGGRTVAMGINVVAPRGDFDDLFLVADARAMPFCDVFVDSA